MEGRKFDFTAQRADQLQIRWSDRQRLAFIEQHVELVRKKPQEWTILSPVYILEATQVYLTGDTYTGNGIVSACRKSSTQYVVTISLNVDTQFLPPRHEFDPGTLEVDNFLTEEEEANILDSLKGEIPYSVMVQRRIDASLRVLWRNTSRYLVRIAEGVFLSLPSVCV